MNLQPTSLSGVIEVTPRRFGDDRGWFSETWSARAMNEAGLGRDWVQDNHSFSAAKGTLRGLHYQAPPYAQAKLVRCTRGAIWDVAVDVRRGSPTFGQWAGVELQAATGNQLLIPQGFLHGFVTLTDDCEVQYKCDAFYAPSADGAVRWDSVEIDWPIDAAPQLSDKDAAAPVFAEWTSPFTYEAAP